MKHFFWLYFLPCLIFPVAVHASGDPTPAGGRSWALAGTAITLADGWAVYNNPGALARVKDASLMTACDVRYGMAGFTTVAFAGVLPLASGNGGISVDRFGDQLYSEQRLGVAYSHQMDRVSLGMKVSYTQIAISEVGVKGRFVFQFGGVAEITPQLLLGAHIYNFTQARLADYQDERLPTVLSAGISWRPVPQLMLNVETEKDIDYTARFKGGAEYQIAKPFFLRMGLATNPGTNHFGFGFKAKKLNLDYAFRTHPALGLSHHLSLYLKLEKKGAKAKNAE